MVNRFFFQMSLETVFLFPNASFEFLPRNYVLPHDKFFFIIIGKGKSLDYISRSVKLQIKVSKLLFHRAVFCLDPSYDDKMPLRRIGR